MVTLSKTASVRRPVPRDLFSCALLFLASRASVMGLHPFGTAAFAACIDGSIAYMGIIFLCLGLITSASASYIIKYLTASLIFMLLSAFVRKRPPQLMSAACGISVILGGVLYSLCYHASYLDIMTAFIEGAVSGIMYIVFLRAAEFMPSYSSRAAAAKDEVVSVALTAGVCVSGLSGINFPLGISLDGIAAAYVTACAAYSCPMASAGSLGLGTGFMCSVSSAGAIASTGFYGLCALLGSMLRDLGKFGTAAGFLGGACGALIYSRFGIDSGVSAPNLVIGSLLFILTPEKVHYKISCFFSKAARSEAMTGGERMRGFLSERLKRSAAAFEELGASFRSLTDIRLKSFSTDAADLFEDTAGAVCRGCSRAGICWEKEFNSTYKRMITLLDTMEQDGRITKIPKSIADKCIRSETLVGEFMHIYSLYRQRELFIGEAARARDLTAAQYAGFAGVLSDLRSSVENDLSFNSESEELLITELDKRGISLFEISVIEDGSGLTEISLGLSGGVYIDKLESAVSEILAKPVEFQSESGGIVKLKTKPCCTVSARMCSVPCDGCDVSGDNIEIFDTDDCRSFVIISDGMGSGADARGESGGIVRLLKQFVCAGYDAETAIRTVNSALCLRSGRESAATIDMLCIDRTTGIARLFKIGCAQTFFLHGSSMDVIFPVSLPAGMVEDIDLEPQTLRLHSGDVLIMVTDGITQSGNGEWIKTLIDRDAGPDAIVRRITDEALKRWGGAAFDDMTCAAVYIGK